MNLGEQVKRIRKRLRKTQEEFGTALRLDQGYISSIENGKKPVTESFLDSLQDAFPEIDVSPIKVDMAKFMTHESHNKLQEPTTQYNRMPGVPVYDIEFSAGTIQKLIETRDNYYPIGILNIPELKGCDLVIRARGNSMADRINDKDWIGIKRLQNWQEFLPWGYIYAIVTDELEIVKYIKKGSGDNRFLIVSHNSDEYEEFELPTSLIREIWAVRAVIPASKFETII